MFTLGRRTRLWAAVAVAAIVVLVVAVYAWQRAHTDTLPDYIARANGRLELTRVDVAAKYPGRLASLAFHEGDQVQAGQVLGVQEDDELRARLAQTEATLARARSEQARARAGAAAQTEKLRLAQLEWRQAQTLLRGQEISPVELDRRQIAMNAEAAASASAGDAVETAGHAVAEAQAQVALAEAMLDGLQLRAPIAGRVEYRVVEPGTMLPPGGRIATLLDPDDVYLTVFYPAAIAARLKIGDAARIVLEGDSRALPATVAMVDADAQFTPKYVETASERENLVYRVKLQIPRATAQRLAGRLKGGITGYGYVRADTGGAWPPALRDTAS